MKIPSSFLVAAVAANIHFVIPEVSAQAEKFVPNYDEAKIPDYVLPDPLEGVGSADDWAKKRAEIFRLIEREMFGKAPRYSGEKIAFAEDIPSFEILDGRARVSQPLLTIAGQDGTDDPTCECECDIRSSGNHRLQLWWESHGD